MVPGTLGKEKHVIKNMKLKLLVLGAIFVITFGFGSTLSSQWARTNFSVSGSVTSFAANDSNIFCGTDEYGLGVFSSSDGMNWIDHQVFPYPTVAAIAAIGSNVFASASGVYRSTDNGSTWTEMASGCGDFIGTSGKDIFADCGPIYRYTIGDTGWVLIHEDLNGDDTGFNCLAQFGSNVVASFPQYYVYPRTPPAHILYSSDNGISWSDVNGDISSTVGMTGTSVSSLTSIGNKLFVGTDSGVFLSTNYGLWYKVNNGMPHFDSINHTTLPVTSLATFGTNIFADLGGWIYLSTNYGTQWSNVTDELPDSIYPSQIIVFNNYIYANDINNRGGIWRRPLSDFGISSVAPQSAIQQYISSYPNPFSTHTQISFTASEDGYAEISIINALGVEVARLYGGELGEGNHSFVFDGSSLPDGNYWCVVQMNGHVQSLPIALVR